MQKSLTRIIGEGTAWTSASTILVKVISLFTILLVLRTLSVYEYGVAELVIAAVGFFSFFQLPGLTAVVVADMGVFKGQGNIAATKGLYWSYVKLSSVMALLATLILFFGAEAISTFYPEHIASYFRILAFTFPLSVVGTAYGALFTVTFRYFDQSISTFLQEFFKLIVISLCLFVFGLKVEAILYGMIGGQMLTFLCQLPFAFRAYRSLGTVSPIKTSMWGTIYAHGKWSVFSSYLGTVSANVRTYLIKFFLGTEAVALFSVAIGLVGHTSSLIPIGNVVTPIIPQYLSDRPRFLRIISKAIKYQILAFLFVTIFASIAFPPIVVWLFPHYDAAMPLYRIMVFGLILVSMTNVFTAIFFSFKAQRDLFFAQIFKLVVVLVSTALFCTLFGLWGAAYSQLAVAIIYALERYRRVRKLVPDYRLTFSSLASFDELDRVILGKFRAAIRRIIA